MTYKIDGSSHRNGVSCEQKVTEILNAKYQNNIDILSLKNDYKNIKDLKKVYFDHQGGTTKKSDINIYYDEELISYISVKNKKYFNGKWDGTFDIINKAFKSFNKEYNAFGNDEEKDLLTYLDQYKDEVNKDSNIIDSKIKNAYNNKVNSFFENISNANIFVELARKEFLKTEYIVIARIDRGADAFNRLYYSREKELLDLFSQEHNYFLQGSNNAFTSRRIVYKDNDGDIIQTPFRLRITLNNGIHSYYGKGKTPTSKNKTSIWTIKIQVDDVDAFTNKMKYIDI